MKCLVTLAMIATLTAGFAWPASADMPAQEKAAAKPSPAEPIRCQGNNLMTGLATSDPELHARIMRNAETLENGQAVFWKLEREGVAPSFLMGTVHLTDERVTQLSEPTRSALQAARSVVIEAADISGERTADALAAAARAAVFTDGQSLEAVLSTEEFRKVRKATEHTGLPAAAVKIYRPWVISMLLAASDCERSRVKSGETVLDMVIAGEAKSRGIPLAGLETTEQQLASLAAVPGGEQIDMLRANLALVDQTDDLMETMVQLYLARRVGAIWDLQIALAGKAGIPASAFEGFQTLLVVERNRRMRDAALPYLDKGGAFIAIGALHLPGKTGLVELFRQSGYTVTAVE